jgi:hypothetical protein
MQRVLQGFRVPLTHEETTSLSRHQQMDANLRVLRR